MRRLVLASICLLTVTTGWLTFADNAKTSRQVVKASPPKPRRAPASMAAPLPLATVHTPGRKPAEVLDPICADFMAAPQTFQLLLTAADKAEIDFDVDADGKTEKIGLTETRGSCPSHVPCLKDKTQCQNLDYTGIPANSYGFGHRAELFSKNSQLYSVDRVENSYVSISRVSKKGRALLCEFREKLEKWQPPPEKNPICEALAGNKMKLVKASKPHVLKGKAFSDSPAEENFVQVDLAGNNAPVGLLNMDILSAVGCSCARQYMALINSFGDALVEPRVSKLTSEENANLSRALAQLTNRPDFCGTDLKWSVVEYERRFYILGSADTQPGEWTLGRILPRELYRWDRQKFVKVCSQDPVLTRGPAPIHLQLPKSENE